MTDVIRDLPRDDRPRERMLMHGASALSSAELLALLLGSGVRGKNSIQLARELLKAGVHGLSRRDVNDVAETFGVGPAKATRIAAAFELSRRLRDEDEEDEPPTYDAQVLGPTLITEMSHHTQERLGAAFLDARNRVLKQREIYVGTINKALVSTRDVVRFALFENASGVVLYHNHPSGSMFPSAEDHLFTSQIQSSLELLDLNLVDHLIIGQKKFYSFAREGLLAKRMTEPRCN
ncbi:MAG TPA: DNA repair protein RadC [Thermoanaerobaculia bacterium]|jgi:DNA repair protein RadC